MFEELKKFFEENKLAIEAADSIKNGRKIRITILENFARFPKHYS